MTLDRRSSCLLHASLRFAEYNKFRNERLLLSNSNLDKFVGNMK